MVEDSLLLYIYRAPPHVRSDSCGASVTCDDTFFYLFFLCLLYLICSFNLTWKEIEIQPQKRGAIKAVSHFILNSIFIYLPMRFALHFASAFRFVFAAVVVAFFAFLLWPANYFCLLFTLCCCRSLSPPAFARGGLGDGGTPSWVGQKGQSRAVSLVR